MERDPELIRQILEFVIAKPERYPTDIIIDGYDVQTVGFHIYLLQDAGYLKAELLQNQSYEYIDARVECLTSKGYDFLDVARNKGIWEKVKSTLREKALSVPLDIFVLMLRAGISEAAGIKI